MLTPREFCEASDRQLHPAKLNQDLAYLYPDDPLQFCGKIGLLLRENQALTKGKVEPYAMQDDIWRVVGTIINSSVDPATKELPVPHFESAHGLSSSTGYCEHAEGRFDRWVAAVGGGQNIPGRLVVDANGKIVAAQKARKYYKEEKGTGHFGSPSAMLFRDAVLVGCDKDRYEAVLLPKGCLVYLEVDPAAENITTPEDPTISVIGVDDVTAMSLLRPSGYCIDPQNSRDWHQYLCEYDRLDEPRTKTMTLEHTQAVLQARLSELAISAS